MANLDKKGRFLVLGCGGIGRRHVEAISRYSQYASIIIIEPYVDASEIKGWCRSCGITDDRLILEKKLHIFNEKFESIVIATSARERCHVLKELRDREILCKLLVLEKVLFQSESDGVIGANLANLIGEKILVNEWVYRFFMRNFIFQDQIQSMVVYGARIGIACNAVHFIGAFMRLTDYLHCDIDHLSFQTDTIYQTKRHGFLDICGKLSFNRGKSSFSMTSVDREEDGHIDLLIEYSSGKKIKSKLSRDAITIDDDLNFQTFQPYRVWHLYMKNFLRRRKRTYPR